MKELSKKEQNMRLFIAINFPKPIKDKLTAAQLAVKEMAQKGRYTREENLHLTLVFIGQTPPERLCAIKKVMDEITAPPFMITVNRLGAFGGRKGSIVWVGVERNKALFVLRVQLADALKKSGFDLEDRVYKPHLTLGRDVVIDKNMLDKISFEPFSFRAESCELMSSENIGGTLVYRPVYVRQLFPA
ncbi:MAG: RNA 2',3'-cyclic phosphodiesterase [Christensenellales bacterium]|jgi:2'-5' RNA ligase